MTVAIAIRISILGMIRAIGTDSHNVQRCGNPPAIETAISPIRGRNRLNTRNQIGNVITFILLFTSIYAYSLAHGQTYVNYKVAASEGFEPPVVLRPHLISSQVQ